MKLEFCLLLAMAGTPVFAQQVPPERVNSSAISPGDRSILPAEKIGADDLLGISVYDSPELSHPVRVDADGAIRLPMVKQPISVSGLYPAEIEAAITKALVDGNVLVAPLVSVSVLEYRSRPITVMGAVRNPIVFQADGPVTLLDAISRAGGLADNAGPDILLSRPPSAADESAKISQRIPVQSFLNMNEDFVNLKLEAGDVVRVPVAGQVYVLGSVKRPGAFTINDGAESSVMKALALSGGLDEHPSHIAYIYRVEAGAAGRNEMPIELKKIMDRKSPDVALEANDILYIPTSNGRRISSQILETSLAVSLGLGTALLYIYH
jgi:polysaccharide export outer membrane protein